MKKIIAVSLVALLAGSFALRAQENKITFKPYGFFRTYGFYDSRSTKSLAEDIFFFIPLDRNEVNGHDVNSVGSYNYQAITSRVGFDMSGYKVGEMNIVGKLEADFYCLNSSGNTGTLRMRQAYIELQWNGRGQNQTTDLSLRIGQGWHPMAADMAHGINLETAAPFSPFNRSALMLFNAVFDKKVTFTAGFIQQLQYRSAGPQGASNKYQRHAMPEIYAGLSYADNGFLGRVGVSMVSIRPQYGYSDNGTKYKDWLTTVSPFIYLQYTRGMFQVKAKSILAQAGEHMQLNGGYAATELKSDGVSYNYTPIRSSASFISAQYGKTFQVLGMVGYYKNFGTSDEAMANRVYFSGNGYANINQMVRVTPTLAYNIGKLQFAVEYDITTVQYGTEFNSKLRPKGDLHWVTNNRILLMSKFTF